MAFLEVITRTYKRKDLLAKNRASLKVQTDDDWSQMIYVDTVGRGVGWANGKMVDIADSLTGDYIWILDDDDMSIRDTFVAELKGVVWEHEPDVIMVRMDHAERGILPPVGMAWPHKGSIGCSAYVVKREVWQRHKDAWRSADYASDYDFILSIFEQPDIKIYWLDVIASKVQRISLGEPA